MVRVTRSRVVLFGREWLAHGVKKAVDSQDVSFLTFFCYNHQLRNWYGSSQQVSMLSEDESDAEVMQRLAPLSRSIQDFIAAHLGFDDWFWFAMA